MNLTIVGLGVSSTALALALKSVTPDIEITGHDPNPTQAERAKRLKAIDKSHWNLLSACERADLVILDLSLQELEKTLHALKGDLKPGAVLLDLLPIKRPVLALAERVLPDTVQFIGGHVVGPNLAANEADPSAAAVKGATFFLVASPSASSTALDMATNLATACGAAPYHIDALEHDGLVAATILLPALSTAALLMQITQQAGWEDRRRAVGASLASLASAYCAAPEGLDELVAVSRDGAKIWLDAYIGELQHLRSVLSAESGAKLPAYIAEAMEAGKRVLSRPSENDQGEPVERIGGWRDMLLGRFGRSNTTRDSARQPRS